VNSAGWTSVYSCLYCVLSYIPLGRCPGALSLDHISQFFVCVMGFFSFISHMCIQGLVHFSPLTTHSTPSLSPPMWWVFLR
jgi:hypothetical protein